MISIRTVPKKYVQNDPSHLCFNMQIFERLCVVFGTTRKTTKKKKAFEKIMEKKTQWQHNKFDSS